MDYTEEEIEELMQLIGGEEFLTSYKEYMQKRKNLLESREQELAKTQLPVFTNYNTKFIDSDLRILDLEFGMQFIVFLITKSITITPVVQKGLDIISKNKLFYT